MLLARPAPDARRGRVLAAALVLLLVWGGAHTRAAEPDDLGSARRREAHLSRRIGHVLAEAARLQRRVLHLAGEVRGLRADLDRLQGRLVAAERETAAARERYDAVRTRLHERAAEAFMTLRPADDLEVLLGASSTADLTERLRLVALVQASDEELAAAAGDEARRLARVATDLEAATAERLALLGALDARRRELAEVFAAQQRELERLGGARRAARRTVDRLERRIAMQAGVLPFGRWAELFLARIDAPACHDNLVVTVAWQANEFTEARWNPLATTHDMPGATAFNEVGVRNFVSLAQGLRATVETLTGGAPSYGYGAIVDALGRCAPALVTAQAIRASAWCRGCSDGGYVTELVPVVETYFERYADQHG